MSEVSPLDEWADRIDELTVAVADATLREVGLVQPPAVHVLVEGACPPYLGYLTCRPFARGDDAAAAVTSLGVLPSVLGASRVLVTWEHADLCTALETPGADSVGPGVAVLDADLFGHVLRWHPLQARAGGIGALSAPTLLAQWGEPRTFPDSPLPGPVEDLLAVWRMRGTWTDAEVERICDNLWAAGYEMRWLDIDDRPAGLSG
jgi:hypothetical protein